MFLIFARIRTVDCPGRSVVITPNKLSCVSYGAEVTDCKIMCNKEWLGEICSHLTLSATSRHLFRSSIGICTFTQVLLHLLVVAIGSFNIFIGFFYKRLVFTFFLSIFTRCAFQVQYLLYPVPSTSFYRLQNGRPSFDFLL